MPLIMDECMEALRIELASTSDEEFQEQVEAVQKSIRSRQHRAISSGRQKVDLTKWLTEQIGKDSTLTGAPAKKCWSI